MFVPLLLALLPVLALGQVEWTRLSMDSSINDTVFSSSSPGRRVGGRAIYCNPAQNAELDFMVQFGGFQANETGEYFATNTLFAFDFNSSSWEEVVAASPSSPRARGWFSMTSVSNVGDVFCKAIIFGGTYSAQTKEPIPAADFAWHLLVWPNRTAYWERIPQPSPSLVAPEPRIMSSAVFRTKESNPSLVIFGGANSAHDALADIWSLNLSSLAWERIDPVSNTISVEARYAHAMTYDDVTDSFYTYGGKNLAGTTTSSSNATAALVTLSAMGRFSFSDHAWTLNVVTEIPRSHAYLFIANRTLFSFGGLVQGRTNAFALNDVFATALDLPYSRLRCANFWCAALEIESTFYPRARFDGAHVMRGEGVLVIYGGRFTGALEDVWQLNLTAAVTTQSFDEPQNEARLFDPLYLQSLGQNMLFILGVLFFLVACYWVFLHAVARTFYYSQESARDWQERVAATTRVPRGVRPEIIAALPIKPYSAMLDLEADHNTCSICLSEFASETPVRVLPCGHYFDPACIDEWLTRHNTCCMCKAPIEPSSANEEVVSSALPPSPPATGHIPEEERQVAPALPPSTLVEMTRRG